MMALVWVIVGYAMVMFTIHYFRSTGKKNGKDVTYVIKQVVAWLVAAVAKFAALYAIVVWLICDVLSQRLLAAGTMKPPMLKALPATFSWPQLITALIGGAVALLMVPVLRKALHK